MREQKEAICAILIGALENEINNHGLSEYDMTGYGTPPFKNNVFSIDRNSEMERPIFTYYETIIDALVVTSYKYWGRGVWMSRECSIEEILKIFLGCFKSLQDREEE